MGWPFSSKKQEEPEDESGGFDIKVVETGTGFTGYTTEHGAALLELEGWKRVEEYYCGLCGCLMPLSHFPH
jgi:hypothetical protein